MNRAIKNTNILINISTCLSALSSNKISLKSKSSFIKVSNEILNKSDNWMILAISG